MERDENSNLVFNFITDTAECGARIPHLANKKIIVAERQEDESFVSHWNRIYQTLNNENNWFKCENWIWSCEGWNS